MALLKTITLGNGLVAPDAYIRIDSLMGCKSMLTVSVNSYLSADAFTGEGAFFKPNPAYRPASGGPETVEWEEKSDIEPRHIYDLGTPDQPRFLADPQPYLEQELVEFAPDLEAKGNFIAQAYAHLKSMPKYLGAVDV